MAPVSASSSSTPVINTAISTAPATRRLIVLVVLEAIAKLEPTFARGFEPGIEPGGLL